MSLAAAAATVLAVAACGGGEDADEAAGGGKGDVQMAVLLPGSKNDQSWNSFGYAGIQAVGERLEVKTSFAENVADADQVNALRTFAGQGFDLIFGHTDRFQNSMFRVAGDFPDTTFVAIAGTEGNGSNVDSVDIAREQFAYVEGWIAGRMTKTNVVGVVSGLEGLPVTVATVGGFRRGVEAANPDVSVRVVYLPDMEDAAAARQAVHALASANADVVLPFLNAGVVGAIEGARDRSIYVFGRGVSNTDLAPDAVLTNVAEDWSRIYVATAQLYLDGKLEGAQQRFGFDTEETAGTTGAELTYRDGQALNPDVSDQIVGEVRELQSQIASGELTVQVTEEDARAGV